MHEANHVQAWRASPATAARVKCSFQIVGIWPHDGLTVGTTLSRAVESGKRATPRYYLGQRWLGDGRKDEPANVRNVVDR